jgi:hypothetical protein
MAGKRRFAPAGEAMVGGAARLLQKRHNFDASHASKQALSGQCIPLNPKKKMPGKAGHSEAFSVSLSAYHLTA